MILTCLKKRNGEETTGNSADILSPTINTFRVPRKDTRHFPLWRCELFCLHRLRSCSSINQLIPRCCVLAASREAYIHLLLSATGSSHTDLNALPTSLSYFHYCFLLKHYFFDILIRLSPLASLLDCCDIQERIKPASREFLKEKNMRMLFRTMDCSPFQKMF